MARAHSRDRRERSGHSRSGPATRAARRAITAPGCAWASSRSANTAGGSSGASPMVTSTCAASGSAVSPTRTASAVPSCGSWRTVATEPPSAASTASASCPMTTTRCSTPARRSASRTWHDERPPGDGVQDLGEARAHARPLAGGQDDGRGAYHGAWVPFGGATGRDGIRGPSGGSTRSPPHHTSPASATHSISTSAPFGSALTATVERAGYGGGSSRPYTSFTAA